MHWENAKEIGKLGIYGFYSQSQLARGAAFEFLPLHRSLPVRRFSPVGNQLRIFKQSLKDAAKYWLPLIKQNWLLLIVILVIVQIQAQAFLYFQKSHPMDTSIQIICQMGIALISMLEAAFIIVLVPLRIEEIDYGRPATSYWKFFGHKIGPLTIEGIRMTALVILWLLLLIIPGIYKQLKWYLMPFIVMFDKDYDEGKIDCLQRSNELVTGIVPLILFLVLFDFLVNYFLDSFAMSFAGSLQYAAIAIIGLLTMGISVYTYSVFYCVYKIRDKEVPKNLEENDRDT